MSQISSTDRWMAERCVQCPVCVHARKTQKGMAFWFVKNIEDGMCPFCKAYEKVYGKKAHERA
jgi:hypothetical protein